MVAFDLVVFVFKHIVAIVMSNMVWLSVKLVFTIIGKTIVIDDYQTTEKKQSIKRRRRQLMIKSEMALGSRTIGSNSKPRPP